MPCRSLVQILDTMSINLEFDRSFQYEESPEGIAVPVSLLAAGNLIHTSAKIDCGSAACLFSNEVGRMLGLDIEAGIYQKFSSLTGDLEAFGHEVTIEICEISVHSLVYFALYRGLPRNLVGRDGWFRKFRVGIEDHDNLLYLARLGS